MTDALVIFVVALVGGTLGTLAVRRFARRFGIVNEPNPIVPQHTTPVAYLGGIGVLAGLGLACVLGPWLGDSIAVPICIVLPAVLYCAVGAADDLRPFRAAPKLAWQIAIAALAVALGLNASFTGITQLDQILTVLWVVTVVNAFNFTDVCDGLVTGLAATFFLGWALFAPTVPLAGWAGFAACLAFLPFNAPRASMFLGDAGSHLVGFLAAAMIASLPSSGPLLAEQMVLLVLVPLFEFGFITSVRIHKGLPWWKGSPDHFSLRLQHAGWSRWRVDIVAWGAMGFGGTLGYLLPDLGTWQRLGTLAGVGVLAVFATRYLLRFEVSRGG